MRFLDFMSTGPGRVIRVVAGLAMREPASLVSSSRAVVSVYRKPRACTNGDAGMA